jgi:hypothetical protein
MEPIGHAQIVEARRMGADPQILAAAGGQNRPRL